MAMNESTLKKHPSLLLHRDVLEINYPFLKKFNFQTLCSLRVYNDNRLLYFGDHRDMLYNYLSKNYPTISPLEQNKMPKKEYTALWSSLNNGAIDPVLIDARKMFNFKCGIVIIQPFEQGMDFFSFGTTDGDISTLNRINSQIEELTIATKIILEKSQKTITKLAKHPLHLEDFSTNHKPTIKDNRLYLGIDYDYNYLTRKEIIYLQQLKKGDAIPTIAKLHKISARTVEKHIEHIKHKLSCKTQYELGYLAAKLKIDEL